MYKTLHEELTAYDKDRKRAFIGFGERVIYERLGCMDAGAVFVFCAIWAINIMLAVLFVINPSPVMIWVGAHMHAIIVSFFLFSRRFRRSLTDRGTYPCQPSVSKVPKAAKGEESGGKERSGEDGAS